MNLAGCRCLWGILLSPFVLFGATHSCRADLVNAGDIAFIGFNTDGNDDFAFVLLADAAIGNVVHFNDNEWVGTQFNATNEGEISWTVTTALSAGTVVTFSNLATSPTASTGTITTNGDVMALSGGEAIYAFTGASATNPTTFLAAFSNDERIYDDSNQADGTLSGTGLIEGSTAVLVARNGTDPADGGQYASARSGEAAFGDYRSLIGNTNANWNVHYTDGTQFVPFDATSFTVLTASTPEADSLGLATLGLFLVLVIRRSQPGIVISGFPGGHVAFRRFAQDGECRVAFGVAAQVFCAGWEKRSRGCTDS